MYGTTAGTDTRNPSARQTVGDPADGLLLALADEQQQKRADERREEDHRQEDEL